MDLWVWGAFTAFILAMLSLDLFVFHKNAHAPSMREAVTWSAIWIGLGMAFGLVLWTTQGGEAAGEYLAGYVIEKSLSVDNIFVFAMLFSYFAVPAAYQHRVLFWGVLGALVFRAIFIGAGAALLEQFHWMIYLFGALLLVTGIKMARHRDVEMHPDRNPILRLLRRVVPMTDGYRGQALSVRENSRRMMTPLFAVLAVVETSDILFAVDSIPAIFAVTRDPFIVFSSNAFAILGLRALYFLLAGMIGRFVYLKPALAVVLVMVGAKMLASDVLHVPIWLSLTMIAVVLCAGVLASLRRTSETAAHTAPEPAVEEA